MSRHVTMIDWDSSPHLSDKAKAELLSAYPPGQRDARTKGVPQLGSGAIYPVPEEDIVVEPFQLPPYYWHAYGMDVGWRRTAAIWGATDRETDVTYLYAEYYRGEVEPPIHAAAIKARGEWIPGVIDPASRGRNQHDGQQLLSIYVGLGLTLTPADNSVEAGLYDVWTKLSAGKLKVFRTLQNWLAEYRVYRRDEKGHVVKENDHLMDACLTGETLVVTREGPRRIKDLAGERGTVLARGGAWADFCGARLTIPGAKVVRLQFSNGDQVVCTPDHPFLTPNGWCQAASMLGSSCYNGVSQRIHWSKFWTRWLSARRFKNSVAFVTTYAADIFGRPVALCTATCGRSITTGAGFRKDSTFTTEIATARITDPRTWFSSRRASIAAFTISATKEESPRKRLPRLRRGMRLIAGANGTLGTTRGTRRFCIGKRSSDVNIAECRTPPMSQEAIGFAPTHAKRDGASNLVLTMKNGFAWCAAVLLWRIATFGNRHARQNALVRCLSVEDAGCADVYCLTVPGPSAFCIEGGLVVHNTRYLCLSGLSRAAQRPRDDWAALMHRGTQHQIDYEPLQFPTPGRRAGR